LLITGGVHGDEFEGPFAIRKLAEHEALAGLSGRLTLAPIVNEAAFALGRRVAEDGLDLARVCPGCVDGSVTERAAHALAELIRAADFYIDLHTGGAALSVWPMTGYMLHPSRKVLDQQRAMARAFNLPVIWGTDPRLEGRSLSVARDAAVPAIYAEYEGGGRFNPRGAQAYVEGCLNVMGLLGMIERPAATLGVQHAVEDPRPGAGHMQRCYPAPTDGLFEPFVELGQPVMAGQPLGAITDFQGVQLHTVVSDQTGRVLVLRTWPLIKPGDSLAVILELEGG
jgi:predicted deacylase